MKVLIAIISCLEYSKNGINQSLRDTWLKHMPRSTEWEYRIFLGDGTPVQELPIFEETWSARGSRYIDKTTIVKYEEYLPKNDEIFLHVPDDYKHISFKTKESHRWAVNNGFDFVFQCYGDLYVDTQRLALSSFENKKYCGGENGGGYWLNKDSLNFTSNSAVTAWNDDGRSEEHT